MKIYKLIVKLGEVEDYQRPISMMESHHVDKNNSEINGTKKKFIWKNDQQLDSKGGKT